MRINSVLDEIYHPFLDCIPKQSDALKVYHKTRKNKPNTGVSPSYDVPFQGTFALPLTENTFFKLQFVKIEPWRFQIWAFSFFFFIYIYILKNEFEFEWYNSQKKKKSYL